MASTHPLTTLKGIGESTAEALTAHGFATVEAIASADVEALARVPRFGERRAALLISHAQHALEEGTGADAGSAAAPEATPDKQEPKGSAEDKSAEDKSAEDKSAEDKGTGEKKAVKLPKKWRRRISQAKKELNRAKKRLREAKKKDWSKKKQRRAAKAKRQAKTRLGKVEEKARKKASRS